MSFFNSLEGDKIVYGGVNLSRKGAAKQFALLKESIEALGEEELPLLITYVGGHGSRLQDNIGCFLNEDILNNSFLPVEDMFRSLSTKIQVLSLYDTCLSEFKSKTFVPPVASLHSKLYSSPNEVPHPEDVPDNSENYTQLWFQNGDGEPAI